MIVTLPPARLRAALRPGARAAALLLAVSMLVFGITALLPGDAVTLRAAGRVDAADLARLRAEAGVDRPIAQRYLDWALGAIRGDLGLSTSTGRPVVDMIGQRLPVTMSVVVAALAVAVPLMLVLALASARGRGRRRSAAAAGAMVAAALPQVVLAALLAVVLSRWAGLVPPVSLLPGGQSPLARPDLLLLPALSLAVPAAAYGAMMLHGPLVDASAAPHVVDAELRGVSRRRVALAYLLPIVAAPAIRILAFVLAGLVCGTALVESIFGLSGLGELFLASITTRDIPVLQAIALLAAAVTVVGMLLGDIASRRSGRGRP